MWPAKWTFETYSGYLLPIIIDTYPNEAVLVNMFISGAYPAEALLYPQVFADSAVGSVPRSQANI